MTVLKFIDKPYKSQHFSHN